MNSPAHPDPQPVIPPVTPPTRPGRIDLGRRPAPSKVGTPARILTLGLGSIAVMAPWPLLGMALMRPYFDQGSEAFMLFGGITLFPLMILALFGPASEGMLIMLVMLVWLAAAALPDVLLRRRLRSWTAIGVLLAVQSAFSLAQAVMGALLIAGKSV